MFAQVGNRLSVNLSKVYDSLSEEEPKPPEQEDHVRELRIQLLGASTVGKTAMTTKYMLRTFSEEYEPTIVDAYRKQVELDGHTYYLSINDAGTDNFCEELLRDIHIKNSDCFVVLYSIISQSSFQDVTEYLEKIRTIKHSQNGQDQHVPVVLIGNKLDLQEDRKVSESEGQAVAMTFGCDFCEISAKNDTEKIDEVFERLILMHDAMKNMRRTASMGSLQEMRQEKCLIQ